MSFSSIYVERNDKVRVSQGSTETLTTVFVGDVQVTFFGLDHVESVAKEMLAAVEAERAKAEVKS